MRQYISILLAVIALCLGSDGQAHSSFDGSAGLKSINSQPFSSEERYDLGSPLNPSSRRYTLALDLVAQSRNTSTVQSPSYETDYYGYDGHGSVRFVFDDQTDWETQGSDTYDYDAYGNLIARTGTRENSYQYAGEYWDEDLDLYYLRARWYDPDLGRFTTMDTYEGANLQPTSLHKYLYAHADPINNIDPSGHFSLANTLVTVGNIARTSANVGVRVWNVYDKVRTAMDGFNAIQSVVSAINDGLDSDDLIMAIEAGGDFLEERIKRRLINGGLKAAARLGGAVIGAAKSGIHSLGKGRLRFEKFEVRAVRSLDHMNEEDLRKMLREGNAGKTKAGDTIHLHHHQQNPNGPIVEIPRPFHKNPGNKRQHPFGTTPGGGLDPDERADFGAWRKEYWKARAAEELALRGLL